MKNESREPRNPSPLNLPAPTPRHDGWTGEKMAKFCEALAETAVVAEACDQARMGISGAYALRRRNPVFAAAWDASLSIARERLADTLLARSMEGNIEQIYRDGELVGERHVLDNRLGLAILRRLDRLAETGATLSSRGERFVTLNRHPQAPAVCHPGTMDWDLALNALRTGDEGVIAEALAMIKGDEVEEVEDPPVSLSQGDTDEDDSVDLTDRCWRSDELFNETTWVTDFPPPPGFDGYESCDWGEGDYQRECTPEEIAALERNEQAGLDAERAEDEALRDAWFDMLREEAEADPNGNEDAEVPARTAKCLQ